MDVVEIREKIKEVISRATSLDPREIPDGASFVDDLALDSLSIFEIGIDVDYEFRLQVGEEKLGTLRTVEDAVALVVDCLAGEALQTNVA